jgi:hypothetical protein
MILKNLRELLGRNRSQTGMSGKINVSREW